MLHGSKIVTFLKKVKISSSNDLKSRSVSMYKELEMIKKKIEKCI